MFTSQLVGGPKDGNTHAPPRPPREGDELPIEGHLYRFSEHRGGRAPAWVYVGPVVRT